MIHFENVRKSYRVDGREVAALHPLDLRIETGEVFGIIGRSGAGKSTLLRLINGLERPSGGRVMVDGVDIAALDGAGLRGKRRDIGMIFQHFNLLAAKTVAQNVAFPLRLAGDGNRATIERRVAELLERVGLGAYANHYPAQLSGGQKQRVGIARALACAPSILLCDEATSALDPETTASVLRLIAGIHREFGLTVVLITHEMDVIRRICDRVAVLDAGQLVEMGEVADVFLHPRHATTQRFVQEYEHEETPAGAAGSAASATRRIRVTLRGESVHAPVLARIARDTRVDFGLLGGRVDRIKDTAYAQLTLALSGGDVEAALRGLREAGAVVEEVA
ncbi:MAG: methionine ABC transporter ATP-binding protein [Proteobacteria bacterium]|uniref:methionine ABC transporter ATP-binding protein n=1 Tax=Rudaea sp. TaxID=2136325 RepID=UPI00322028D0|nr:methionine ABC transporter ATP-binding protein [Pseudomonadota bacterium]